MVGEWAHASACTYDLSHVCWPTRAHRQYVRIFVMGQSETLLGSCLNNLCWPMRHFRASAHIVLDGPMRANCKTKNMVGEWAHTSTCTYDLSHFCWPTRAHRQYKRIFVMGQSESLLGSHLNNLCGPMQHFRASAHIVLDGPMRANCKKNTWWMNGPIRALAPTTFHTSVGQLELIGNISAFS